MLEPLILILLETARLDELTLLLDDLIDVDDDTDSETDLDC